MATISPTLQDPRTRYPKPPFKEQEQDAPGSEARMQPEPDYGYDSYVGAGKLEGRVALITGADSGIGRAVALAYAREGADVAFTYLDEDNDAEETVRVVKEAGRNCVALSGDVKDEEFCKNLVAATVEELGHLDILVNNAAYQMTYQDIADITEQELDRIFRTNVFALFYLCKAAIPLMQPGSTIINTASIQAYQPDAVLLPYAVSKGAIVNFTHALAEYAIEKGIRVNAVAPGATWTPLIPSTMPGTKVANFGKNSLLKRPAQPAELAPVYVLLASPESSYVTGMVYGVTGGQIIP